MARGLYRVYLYTVTILLAGFLTGALAYLLNELFGLTPLRGSDIPPSSSAVTQSVIFFGIAVIIGGGLAALHYWLIRRDSAHDPNVNESGARTFLLNAGEAIATVIAISVGSLAVGFIGQSYAVDISPWAAISLSALALALALEWERRRLRPTHGVALIFERLRRHGLPLYLLISALVTFYAAIWSTERIIAEQANILACNPPNSYGYGTDYTLPTCGGHEVIGQWLSVLVVTGSWLWFLWLGRRDAQSLLRQVILLIGWAAGGMILLAIALERVAEYVLRLVTPGAAHPTYFNEFDFGPLLLTASVALAVYGWALGTRADNAMSARLVRLTMRALAGAILAAPLFIGLYFVLYRIFELLAHASTFTPEDWDATFGLVIAGMGYIPLAFWLGADTRAWDIKGPRRGFVLALLAAGALVTAGAAATLLFAVVTPLLDVPLENWQETARGAGAALITGLVLGGLYLFIALRERQFIPSVRPPEAPAPVASAPAAPAASLDETLAQFKAGDLSQEATAERIRELARAGALV
jgi:hypothetical protein